MISIIMPVFNEATNLGHCLDALCAEQGIYEIIVVDGGSSDNTVAIAQARPEIKVIDTHKGRGSQMNAGASMAKGKWLLFLHADTFLEKQVIPKLMELAASSSFRAACFWHRFDSRHPWLHIVSLIHNLRFRYTGVIYGDQGMLIERELFFEIGGFKENIVMEDIEFSERLLAFTRPICLPLKAVTSARKFYALGIYRATLRVLWLMYAYSRRRKDLQRDLFFSDIR
jgi:rSAM/selenodomain-associated transferase 2